MSKIPFGRMVYCRASECRNWANNSFKCDNFWLPDVVDGKFVKKDARDLKQWDLIFFFPAIPMSGHGTVAVVHDVLLDGTIILGNLFIEGDGMRRLEKLNVKGRI